MKEIAVNLNSRHISEETSSDVKWPTTLEQEIDARLKRFENGESRIFTWEELIHKLKSENNEDFKGGNPNHIKDQHEN